MIYKKDKKEIASKETPRMDMPPLGQMLFGPMEPGERISPKTFYIPLYRFFRLHPHHLNWKGEWTKKREFIA
jgi:hypothetical protein